MARMNLKPKTDRSTLLLCAGGGVFAVVATVAAIGAMFGGGGTPFYLAIFMAVAAVGCLFGAFLPPGLVEDLVARYRSGEDYHGDSNAWDDWWHNDPAYSDAPGNTYYTSDPFDD